MKPDWKDAPEWAEWLYPTAAGTWAWSSRKPAWAWFGGFWQNRGIYEPAIERSGERRFPYVSASLFKSGLERRPQTTTPLPEGQGAEGQPGA